VTAHPFLSEGRADVLAHRGASDARPPGNTLAAFRAALAMGCDHLETDVQCTSDGEIVVFHDDRLDDLTTGTGTIAEHTWEELASLRYVVDGRSTDDGLVRLDTVVTSFPDARLNIDAKTDDVVEPLIALLRRHDMRHRVCVASFGWRRLRRLRRALGKGWCTALSQPEIVVTRVAAWLRLPVPRTGDVAQLPRRFRAGGVSVTVIDRRLVEACHRAGIAVHCWTVDDPDAVSELFELGVDAVITDRPDVALRVGRSHG
jgi:glycerophosphoryl diester phosphodiesterase